MAQTITCDWCGEPITDCHPDHPPHLDSSGIGADNRICRGAKFHYHHDGEDSCLCQAIATLKDKSRWAHGAEESGLEWRLMPRVRRTEGDGTFPVMDEWATRVEKGTPIYTLDLTAKADRGLREANLVTLEEVAARSADEIRAIDGVGPKSYRRLVEELESLGLSFGEEGAG